MSFRTQDVGRQAPTPRQYHNPAFRDGSLERHDPFPPHGTQYEFARYSSPDRPNQVDPIDASPVAGRRIPAPSDGYFIQGDGQGDAERIPPRRTTWQQGGPHVLHRRHTIGGRYEENPVPNDEMAMENLLSRLPSKQLEIVANIAAITLTKNYARKKSMHGTMRAANLVANVMNNDEPLDMDEEGEMEEMIRGIPATMAARRSMKHKLSSRKRKAPSFFKRLKYSMGMWWKHVKDSMAELRYSLELWHSHLKKIEGNFGSDVLSYFLFLKWLLLINIPTLVLVIGFIVIPQALHRWFQQEPSGYRPDISFTGLELLTGEGWFTHTELYYGHYTNGSIHVEGSEKKYHMQYAYLFTFGGYYLLSLIVLGHSILRSYRKYYIEAGGIQSMQIVFKILGSWDFGLTSQEAIKLRQKSMYNEIKEYVGGLHSRKKSSSFESRCKLFGLRVVTNLLCLGISAGATYLVYYMSISIYQDNFERAPANTTANITTAASVATAAASVATTAASVATTAASVASTAASVATTAANVTTTTANLATTAANLATTAANVSTIASNVATTASNVSTSASNVATTASNVSATAANIVMTVTSVATTEDFITVTDSSDGPNGSNGSIAPLTNIQADQANEPILLMALPLALGGLHLFLPFVFTFFEGIERYEDPKTSLYVHVVRSMLLRMGTLSMLLYYWYQKVASQADSRVQCWETYMGQDLYRLMIVDFLFTLLGTFFSEFIRGLIAGSVKRVEHPTFAIGRSTLELIYSQTLCWIGTFYAPLLSLIMILKLIFIFYVRMISVLRSCKPSQRPWRAKQTHTVFLGFLFVFFLCSVGAVAVGVIFIKPSGLCGPFQGLTTMYTVVPELIESWEKEHKWLAEAIKFISSPGFTAAVLVALGTGVYLIRTIMIGRKETVQKLKLQLVLEGKDKTFLLNLLNQVSQQEDGAGSSKRFTQHSEGSYDTSQGTGGGRVFVRQMAESAVSAK